MKDLCCGSRCRSNLTFKNFTSLFCGQIVPESVLSHKDASTLVVGFYIFFASQELGLPPRLLITTLKVVAFFSFNNVSRLLLARVFLGVAETIVG